MSHITTSEGSAEEVRSGDVAAGIPVKLTKEELRELSRVNPILSALHIVAEWGMIAVTIYLCQRFWSPFIYILAIAFIGARQHALLVLMHDGVHYRLFRNRAVNDWMSEVVLAWPHLISARAYRKNHFAHHRYLNTAQDPDWKRREGDPAWIFPIEIPRLAKLLFRDITGMNAILLLKLAASLLSADTVSASFLVVRYGFYAVVVGTLVYAGALKGLALYWLVPLFTVLVTIMRVRSIAEHSAIDGEPSAYPKIRTTRAMLLERIFLAPKNVNYHIEHHFFPSVPFYRLPKLHAVLLSKPGFREGAHLTDTYFGVLAESVGRSGSRGDESRGRHIRELRHITPIAEVAG